jgi:hypothetical protein
MGSGLAYRFIDPVIDALRALAHPMTLHAASDKVQVHCRFDFAPVPKSALGNRENR